MCDVAVLQTTLEAPLTVYKLVRQYLTRDNNRVFTSQYDVKNRTVWEQVASVDGKHHSGDELKYVIGEETTSSRGPGIMAYTGRYSAMYAKQSSSAAYVVLECEVPAGTKIRYGRTLSDFECIAAEKIKVIREIPCESPHRYY